MAAELNRGEAGRRDSRGDLWVGVSLEGEQLTVRVQSKVALYYGDAIEQQASTVLQQLGLTAATVEIDDQGALPFAIGARVEAAARRAGASCPAPRQEMQRPSTAKDRLRRSRLYLPGNEPKYMINAAQHGPDGVILDLEDSVHAADKDAARILVRDALCQVDFGDAERMVRINQLPLGLEDLREVIPAQPDLILIPKVERAEQLVQVDQQIRQLAGDREVWLMPIIESALGIENAFEIASASTRVVALTIGLEDYTADLGVAKTKEGQESHWARQRLVNAARAAGSQCIDSVYGDVGDSEGLLAWARRARSMGFEGMGCVHPRQIEEIHRGFAPNSEEIARAQKIVAAFEQAQNHGLAVVSLGSKMIDPPVVQRALKLVRRAEQMQLLPRGDEEAPR